MPERDGGVEINAFVIYNFLGAIRLAEKREAISRRR